MSELRTCPQCGSELPADAPAGLCPRCLLQLGFESQAGPGNNTAAYQPGTLPPPIEELAARFPQLEILEQIGQGGMGVVYKARQKELDRIVALKILRSDIEKDPNFAERFVREARALARLSHPAIVTVHDFGRIDGLYYFVMEYVDGANLRELERSGKLQPQQALALVPQICEALQYAHDQGVVHRDIKPENILISKDGQVKIADFGLAKMVGTVPETAALTGIWQVMGTPHYMAPEQMQSTHQVDHRADIYSLGVVIYEMLTGELPVGRFLLPSQRVQVDVRLDEVVLRALEREPERRYQKASDVKTEVETICGMPSEAARRIYGHEYRSKTTFFGLPLVHIAFGIDPRTGRPRTAKGIIAIGDRAVGVVAIGGAAVGGLAIGGAAFGLLSLGGLAIGILAAVGGLAIGGLAFGGGAIGVIAIGGGAVGVYAFGGGAWGLHIISSTVRDPEALRFFEPWAANWMQWLTWLGIGMPVFGVVMFVLIWLVFWAQHRADERRTSLRSGASDLLETARQQVRGPALGLLIIGVLNWIGLPVVLSVLAYLAGQPQTIPQTAVAAIAVAGFLFSGLILFAGFKMKRLEAYPLAIVGSVLAMIVTPGNLIGFPIGIWALAVLSQREVKAAFRRQSTFPDGSANSEAEQVMESKGSESTGESERRQTQRRPFSVTLLALACLLVSLWWLIGAGLMLALPDAEEEGLQAFLQDRPGLQNWHTVVQTAADWLVFPLGYALFGAGVGLLLMRSWGRLLALGWAVAQLILGLASLPLVVATVFHFALAPEGQPEPTMLLGGFLGTLMIIVLDVAFPILVLLVLNRPHVQAAFVTTGEDNPPSSGSAAATWWRGTIERFSGVIRAVLLVLYLLCFWMFFSFQASGGPGFSRMEYTIGVPASWFEFQFEAGKSHHFAFHLLSPAWLVALAAFVILHVLLRLRPAETPVSRWELPQTHAVIWFLVALIATTWGWIVASLGLPEEAGVMRFANVGMVLALWLGAIVGAIFLILVVLNRPNIKETFAGRRASAPLDEPVFTPPPAAGTRSEYDGIHQQLRTPAAGLFLVGLGTLLTAAILALWSGITLARIAAAPEEPQLLVAPWIFLVLLIGQVVVAGLGALMMAGAVAMSRLEFRGLALTAGITAMLPISPLWPLALPVGLWACLSLSRGQVRRVFTAVAHSDEPATPDGQISLFSQWQAGTSLGLFLATATAAATVLPWDPFGSLGLDSWGGILVLVMGICSALAIAAVALFPLHPRWQGAVAMAGSLAIFAALVFGTNFSLGELRFYIFVPEVGDFRYVYGAFGFYLALVFAGLLLLYGMVALLLPAAETPPETAVRLPANLLFALGILDLLCALFGAVTGVFWVMEELTRRPQETWLALLLVSPFILFPPLFVKGLLEVFGAQAMRRLRRYGLAVAGGIAGLGSFPGTPLGIAVLVVLNRPSVRTAFQHGAVDQ